MSDQSGWPAWTPPGDESEGGDLDPAAPPPPPPPPAQPSVTRGPDTGMGWSAPPPPGAEAWPPPTGADGVAYGGAGWQPPPPRQRTGLVVGVVIGAILLALVLAAGFVVALRSGGEVAEPQPFDQPGAPVQPEEVPAGDVEAQTRAILQTIDASERRMIAFQETVVQAVGEDEVVDDGAAQIARAAQQAGNDLTELRTVLRSLGDGEGDAFEGLRDVRDRYGEHLQAWIDYVDAVGGTPTLAGPQSPEAEPFWQDINTTGDSFVNAMARSLPDDIPAALQDLADEIVERGFGGYGGGDGSLV